MMQLWVDDRGCDIDQSPTIPLDFDASKLTNVEGARSGRTIEMMLPSTPINDAIFGAACNFNSSNRFNMEHHTARIESEGVVLFEGTIYLLATVIKDGVVESYSVRISEGGAEWIEKVVYGHLTDLDIDFSGRLNLATIASTWEGNGSVRFLPIYRGNYLPHYSTSSIHPVERVLLCDDYHPFISIRDMVQAIFAKTGYTLRSNFLDSEFFRSLYMSGDYARIANAAAKAKCDFLARRSSPGEATADFFGKVYASASVAANSVGAIVDTANPEAVDSKGEVMSDTFCVGNSFSLNGAGNACFTPRVTVKAGFLLHLEYTTEYKIRSRERFIGFDVVEGLSGERVEIALANNFRDYRGAPETNMEYRAIVFDHVDGRKYRLSATLNKQSTVVLSNWSARTSVVLTPESRVTHLRLYYQDSGSDSWQLYEGDWALYPSYVEECGSIDVEMDLRISPQEVAAGESLLLDKLTFGGAESGMKIVVGSGTTLRPYFTTVPGYNAPLEFADIAPRDIRQLDLLMAIGEMFNLAFYTDRVRKEVVIEPLEELYLDEEIDWGARIDSLAEVSVVDLGVDSQQNFVLSYIDADRASHNFNLEGAGGLGRWSFRNPLYGSKASTKQITSRLFTTTLNTAAVVASAPSASIMQVGDVGEESVGMDSPFTPRIVCYKGMRTLPSGECWTTSARLESYPYAAFLDDEVNLCFENRNGLEGLHRHYLPMLHRQRDSQSVTLDLYLTTAEVATLFTADGTKPSIRSKFRFEIQGESSLFRLVGVEEWNHSTNIVRCRFERE